MKQIFDQIRKMWVAATPEEIVRQLWVGRLIQELGYPRERFVVEKQLKSLPHLSLEKKQMPDRRTDIVFLGKDIHPLYPFFPLLLIECKQDPIGQKALDQVCGYNLFVQAFCVAVANQKEITYKCKSDLGLLPPLFLPRYADLITSARLYNFSGKDSVRSSAY